MEKNLDWDTPSPVGEEAILDPYSNEVVSAPLPEKEAKKRALKIKVAFSGDEAAPSYEEILADVTTQREDRLKDRLAQSEAIKKTQLKQNLIREVVNSGDSSPEALSFLQGLSAEEIIDKEGILEKKYAEWRVNMGLSSDESGTVQKAMEANPDAANDRIDSSVDRLYRFEIAGSARQRAEAKYAQTGIGRTLLDFGFGMLPWAEAQEAKNITPDNVNVEGILPSNVRRSQIRDLFAMPSKEFEATVAQMEREADESGDWKPFIQLMQDLETYSAYQGQVDNAWAIISLAELAPGGIVFDAVKGVGRVGVAGGRSIAAAEARRKAAEAVSGAVSTPPTGQAAKAAGEAPVAPSGGTAQTMAEEANAAAGKGTTTVTVDGQTATAGVQSWTVGTKTFTSAREVNAALQQAMAGQSKRQRLLADEQALAKYAEERGETPEAMRKLLSDNFNDQKARVEELGKIVNSPEFKAAEAAERKAASNIKFTDKTDKQWNPETGMVEDIPQPILTKQEVVLSAVAEKAAGDPRPVDEIAAAIANDEPLFLESQLRDFEAKIADPDPATYRETGKVITGRQGEKYKINEVSPEEMKEIKGDGRTPVGFIRWQKTKEGAFNIYIDRKGLEKAFKGKTWVGKNGKLSDGSRAFPVDAFSSEKEFIDFVIEHEIAHIPYRSVYGKAKNSTELATIEEHVTYEALGRIGRRDLQRKMFPELHPKVPGPDPDVSPAPPKAAELGKKTNPPKKKAPEGKDPVEPHVIVDVPNAAIGGKAQVQIPATDEALWQIYLSNVEAAGMMDMSDDAVGFYAAHGDLDKAGIIKALEKISKTRQGLFETIKEKAEDLFRKLPSIYDPTGAVVGRPNHVANQKLANNLAEGKYKPIVDRQLAVSEKLKTVFEESQTMGALRLSEDVFDAIKDIAVAQTKKELKSPSSAILNISFRREWESTARTNEVVYHLGAPDGRAFVDLDQARVYAEDMYGLLPGNYGIRTLNPTSHVLEVAKVIDETDPNILSMAIQTDTKTPMSFANTWIAFLRSPGEISSETLRQNFRVSTHHANKLHEAFVVAAKDIGKMTKKEIRNLDALMEAKRNVEKLVYDPVTGKEEKVIGEWFENAQDLEKVYKRAFGEYPSENVISAYFTMRQMYDFDLLHRNLKLYSEKTRKGFKQIRPYIPIPDDRNPGMVKWVQMKEGFEGKVLDELPSGDFDVLVLDAERAQAHHFKTAKSGKEGIKDLQSKGYKLIQLAAPNQLPLKNVKNSYVNIVVTKDVTIGDLSLNQLPATEGGHIRYSESVYLKQPKYVLTEDGEKLHVGDTTILGMSSDAEGAKRMADYDTGRQLLKAGDIQGLVTHLRGKIPMSVGEFEALFKPTVDNTGKVVKEPLLDLDTPIVWVRDGQGTNDAAKTHAPQLQEAFKGVRDTIDDPLNEMAMIGKKYTGEKDSTLNKIVEENGVLSFQKARMISPMETLEQAWAEISRNMATDNMKIQAATTWVEEAADALLVPLDELRRNPWEALNNPKWNQQYGDLTKIRTLDAQRRQILHFLGQKDSLGSSLDLVRNKLLNSVFEKKGQQAADFVDDHVLPNVTNPLQFIRSFAFHTKMGFFNPVQLFLQSNTMINTWAITGNLQRVGSALSGVTLMQMSRINRTPQVLADLARKSEKLGWRPGEWAEMDSLFHKLALHTVEGEHGTLDVMTNPKMFKGAGGWFLDKGLVFFREGERAVRMNAFAVAFKEFRDKFPEKVITNLEENRIMSRAQVLMGMMNRGDNALWQKGLTGPMTQFWGYQARIMEQLLGKQLTRAEKLRLGTAFAAMYGIPVSLAATHMFQIPGWSTDDIRQYALENGIDVSSGIGSIAMNGIPAELIRWMTSDENGQGGLLLGIGDRYGPGGLTTIKSFIEAKDGVVDAVVDLAFGASGSIARDFFKQVLPEDWDIIESATNAPKLGLVDYANMFSTISTVNNSVKLYWAIKTHQNITRDGMNLGDKSPLSAFVSFTTGLEEQRFKDTFLKMDSLKDLKTANDELGKEYLRMIRKAKLLPAGSEERAYTIKKARALLVGMDPKEVKRLIKLGIKPSGSFEQSVGKSFEKEFKE